jgi:hypothetical protein
MHALLTFLLILLVRLAKAHPVGFLATVVVGHRVIQVPRHAAEPIRRNWAEVMRR